MPGFFQKFTSARPRSTGSWLIRTWNRPRHGLVARLLVIDFETKVGSVDQRGFPVSIPEPHIGQVVLYT